MIPERTPDDMIAVDGDRIYSAVDDVRPKATLRLRRLRLGQAAPGKLGIGEHDGRNRAPVVAE